MRALQTEDPEESQTKENTRAIDPALLDMRPMWQGAAGLRQVQSDTRGEPAGGHHLP
jgi:hypothetical protein